MRARKAWTHRDWMWAFILVACVIATYAPVWWAGFIWDDDAYITGNPVVVGPLGLKEIWTTKAADICPLTITSFWVEHIFWRLNPLPFHLVNVFLHGLNAIFLWRVLTQLKIPGAWLGAALWALHPVLVESVAWVAELKNTQATFFYLLSILFFTRYLQKTTSNERGRSSWDYCLTLFFAAMAIASKSSTVILPLVLCLCAWWINGRWEWRTFIRVAPILLMSFAAVILSLWTEETNYIQWPQSWPQRLIVTGDALWFYLGKLLWPYPLITVYPRWEVDDSDLFAYLPLIGAALALLIFTLNRKTWARPWLFVSLYFVIALLPVLDLVDHGFTRFSFVADRFQNLACMGPLALVAAGLVRLLDLIMVGGRWTRWVPGAGILIIIGYLSWQRTWAYENSETLWVDTLNKNPACWVGYSNLATAILGNRLDQAISLYEKALEINPNYADAYRGLGEALVMKGKTDQAINQFQLALEINPRDTGAHSGLGVALATKGETAKAIAQFQAALKIDSYDANIRANLGKAFMDMGKIDDAITQFQNSLQLSPDIPNTHNDLGYALMQKGRFEEAIDQFQRALQLRPGYTHAQENLVKAQAMGRQTSANLINKN